MQLKDFIKSIDSKTPENILVKKSVKELKDIAQRNIFRAVAEMTLEGAIVESVYANSDCLMIILSKGGKVYGLDWTDGCGVILSEYIPPEPIVY